MRLPLFDSLPHFDRETLAARLRALAADGIWIGGSSWKYEGWLDQIYTRDRYLSRGKFSKKRFEAECLAEYAEVFPVVCGDFSFYQFPPPEYWQKFFAAAPASLRFALKVPEELTAERFPKHPRYRPRAGLKNELYLDAGALSALFLEPLDPHRARVSTLIFEFGARTATAPEFLDKLEPFLAALPSAFRYAVEVRNPDYLGAQYFDCLRAHRIAHVFNAWTRMPPLSEQLALAGSMTADFTVVRALLRQGRAYEDAVAQLSPYDQIRDENAEGREALRALIQRMRAERRKTYIFANNRFEGNAPETIRAITAPDADDDTDE